MDYCSLDYSWICQQAKIYHLEYQNNLDIDLGRLGDVAINYWVLCMDGSTKRVAGQGNHLVIKRSQ